MRIKIFQQNYLENLEEDVNTFLYELNSEVIDIKYSIIKSGSCAKANETYFMHSAMIIYK